MLPNWVPTYNWEKPQTFEERNERLPVVAVGRKEGRLKKICFDSERGVLKCPDKWYSEAPSNIIKGELIMNVGQINIDDAQRIFFESIAN